MDAGPLFVFLTAPFVGSFLGVLVLRLPAGQDVVVGRSHCGDCGQNLAWRDLIPLLSWLVSGARCRICRARLSVFYPGIELAALFVAVWAGSQLSGPMFLVSCGFGWCLLTLAAADQRSMILPDALTLPLVPVGLLVAFSIDPTMLPDHLIGAGVGYGVFRAMAVAYRRLRGVAGLGLGDAKLMAGAGAWLSWSGLPSVVLMASVAGLILVLSKAAVGRQHRPGERIPFGPCICLAIWLVWLYGPLQLG